MTIRTYLFSLSRRAVIFWLIGAGVVVVVAVIAVHHFTAAPPPDISTSSGTPHVQVASVADLSAQAGPLSVIGTVASESQASILAQTSGEIVSLSHAIGDYVAAGGIIGEFENSSQKAAVTQAQGAYDAAQAALAKASGATAANSGITSVQASTAASNAAALLAVALKSAYSSLDDAVHTKADTLFSNPRTATPLLLPLTIPDGQLVINIENERANLGAALNDASAAASASSSASISANTAKVLADAQQVGSFLGDVITALNEAVPNNTYTAAVITVDQTTLAAARTEVVSAISSVTASQTAYDAALSASQTASNSATGGTANDIAAAEATLKTQQGGLDAANANLEKTIIRSPISGTIVSLPVTLGDYVTANAPVAMVSNPSALYVDAEVTSDDAKTLAVGNVATIDGDVSGVITFVAPALDPSTGKIEVKVGITGEQSSLTDGEAVSLTLGRNKRAAAPVVGANGSITIPIVAIKITPSGAVAFTVSTTSTLAAEPITLGSILGDQVVVYGLSPETEIVTDARGLSAGQVVILDSASTDSTSSPQATSGQAASSTSP